MQNASEYDPNEALTLLLQGPPGAGKTTLALQFPHPYLLSLDGNIGGPIRWLRKNNRPADFRFDTPIQTKIGTKVAIESDENKHYGLVRAALETAVKDEWVETIIIDNWTVLSDILLAEVRRQNARSRENFRIQDWGDFIYIAKNFVNWCKAQGKMVIFIAHERPETDTVDGIIKYFLQIPGQFGNIVGGMVSDIWRCEVEKKLDKYTYIVRTMPDTRVQLKQSLGLPHKFEMTWDKIADALKANATLNQPTPTK